MSEFVAGDTGSKLRVTCVDSSSGAAINLTGSTVKLRWVDQVNVVQERTMAIVAPATDGIAEYQFAAVDLFAGVIAFEVKITDGPGNVLRNVNLIDVRVRAPL